MAYLIGAGLALAICRLATVAGLDRDRAFYPTITIVIAFYYALFAVMGGSVPSLARESVVIAGFLLASLLGFKRNLWLLVGALVSHGVFDFIHGRLISNPGVPAWWPAFCLSFDVTAAGYLAWLLQRDKLRSRG